MSIHRKSSKPAGITNASGQPEIVLEIDGLTLSMTPPGRPADDTVSEPSGGAGGEAGQPDRDGDDR